MKKFISLICALGMLCGLSSVSLAAQGSTLSLSATYLASDWETSKDAVTEAGDIIMLSVNASDVSDMSTIGEKCNEFSTVMFTLTYDKDAITPYMDTVYEATTFAAKYTNPRKNIPTADTQGIITTGSASFTSNTAQPGYVADGKTTMVIMEATSGFALNGDFMTFYFEVVDPSKSCDIGIELNDGLYLADGAKLQVENITGTTVAGMGTPVEVDKVEVKADDVVIKKDNASKLWTFGFGGTVEITGNAGFTKLVFDLKDTANGKTGSYTWDLGASINATVTYGLNIMSCPVDSNITATVTAE